MYILIRIIHIITQTRLVPKKLTEFYANFISSFTRRFISAFKSIYILFITVLDVLNVS